MGMKRGSRWKLLVELPDSDWKWSSFLFGCLVSADIPLQTKQQGPNERFFVALERFDDAIQIKADAWERFEKLAG